MNAITIMKTLPQATVKAGGDVIWVCRPENGEEASGDNGTMIAFAAGDRKSVDECQAATVVPGAALRQLDAYRPNTSTGETTVV